MASAVTVLQPNSAENTPRPASAIKPELAEPSGSSVSGKKIHGPRKLPQQVSRRNARERRRVQQVNMGFVQLRDRLPTGSKGKKLSKVETLRNAARYIQQLQQMLSANETMQDTYGTAPAGKFDHTASPWCYADSAEALANELWQQQQNTVPHLPCLNDSGSSSSASSGSPHHQPFYSNTLPNQFSMVSQNQCAPFGYLNSNVGTGLPVTGFASQPMARNDFCNFY